MRLVIVSPSAPTNLVRFVKELDGGVGEKAQLGLGHSYSRAKVQTGVLT